MADWFVRHTDRCVLLVRPDEAGPPPDPANEVVLEHLLVPLDGSELSKEILEPATVLGSLFDARYTLLRVVTFPVELASPYLPHTVQLNREFVEEGRVAAEADLEQVAAELRERGLQVATQVEVSAQAANVILDGASEAGADLVALATHGWGPVARVVLGSTTDKVIRGAHRPVLVVRPPEED